MKNQKSGISLIVLVITIIVIVILAVAVILSIANNNPIENANKAKFQSDLKSIKEELELVKASNYAENKGASYGLIFVSDLSTLANYKEKFAVADGEIVMATNKLSNDEKIWAKEIGITEEYYMLTNGENGVTIENNKLSIDKSYWDNNIKKIIIPEGVNSLSTDSTNNSINVCCQEITNVILPDSLEVLQTAYFPACQNLETVVIPNTVTEIGISAFSSKTTLIMSKENYEKLSRSSDLNKIGVKDVIVK